jgi:hypothetical protein
MKNFLFFQLVLFALMLHFIRLSPMGWVLVAALRMDKLRKSIIQKVPKMLLHCSPLKLCIPSQHFFPEYLI